MLHHVKKFQIINCFRNDQKPEKYFFLPNTVVQNA